MVLSGLLSECKHVIGDTSIWRLPLVVDPAQVPRSLGELVALTIVTVLIVTFAPIGHCDSGFKFIDVVLSLFTCSLLPL